MEPISKQYDFRWKNRRIRFAENNDLIVAMLLLCDSSDIKTINIYGCLLTSLELVSIFQNIINESKEYFLRFYKNTLVGQSNMASMLTVKLNIKAT